MSVVADEAPEPSAREFTRVVTDEHLGIPLDEALEVTAKRMQNVDMDQVAVLALVQREAGRQHGRGARPGDSEHPRADGHPPDGDRADRSGQVLGWIVAARAGRACSSSSRSSTRSQLDPLFNQTIGQIFAVSALVMVLLGFLIIRKIVTIEL